MSLGHEHAIALLSEALRNDADQLCLAGLAFADLGGGICSMHALAGEKGSSRSVVVILNGPIPDDLVQALGQYAEALSQDLKTSGKLKTIYED
jgi:hypothetical protein